MFLVSLAFFFFTLILPGTFLGLVPSPASVFSWLGCSPRSQRLGCGLGGSVPCSRVVTAAATAAGTWDCLGSSLAGTSSALEDGEVSVEALVALSVSAEPAFSSEGAGAWGAAGPEQHRGALPFFSSKEHLQPGRCPRPWGRGRAFSLLLLHAISHGGFILLLVPSASAASPFFSPWSFFLVVWPRKLA
uniref:Secreted protein n=1 Tax=Castor canadensis TaxID=51338 RepID=A0A8C0ZTA3_CASCN